MKTRLIVIIAVLSCIIMFSGITYSAVNLQANGELNVGTGIIGTYHDLSSTGIGASYGATGPSVLGSKDRICVYCHAPHNALKTNVAGNPDYLPLWNHTLSTQATYQVYTHGTATTGDPNDIALNGIAFQGASYGNLQPGGVSRLCLSCHDGSVAVNTYGANQQSTTEKPAGGSYTIAARAQIGAGGDLSNHHPIGFLYDGVQSVDSQIAPSSTVMNNNGLRIKDVLFSGNMECATCHDVHNSKNDRGAEKFLWKSDAHSALCLTCHLKGQL